MTRTDVLDAFLNQAKPDNPERYIRFAIEVGQGEWFPLHYFAKLAGMSRAQLLDFINGTAGTPSRKAMYIKRIKPNAAYNKAVGKPKAFLERLLAGDVITVVNVEEASQVARAIQSLPNDFQINAETMLGLLKQCLHVLEGKAAQSYARRAIGRIDELLFAQSGESA